MKTWREHFPNWEFRLWSDDAVKGWEFSNRDIFDRCSNPAEKADLLRYAILYEYGGLYADCDMECLQQFEWLICESDLVAARENKRRIGNALIGVTPRHQAIKAVLDAIPHYRHHRNVVIRTGPGLLSRLWRDSINLFSGDRFYPFAWNKKPRGNIRRLRRRYPDAVTIHHFSCNWRAKK